MQLSNEPDVRVVTDVTGQVVTVFEYQNTFGFGGIQAGVDAARVAWRGSCDFSRAKQAYEQEYDLDKLLAGEYD